MLAQSLDTAELVDGAWKDVGAGPGSRAGDVYRVAHHSDQAQSVVDDVTRIRRHPLVPAGIPIYGYIYDVTSGRLVEVPEATTVGRVTNQADLGAAVI